jgi:hypothetical protein
MNLPANEKNVPSRPSKRPEGSRSFGASPRIETLRDRRGEVLALGTLTSRAAPASLALNALRRRRS